MRRLRVTWEMPGTYSPDVWVPVTRDGDEGDVLDQYHTLKEWSETGEEPIRNVRLFELSVGVTEVDE